MKNKEKFSFWSVRDKPWGVIFRACGCPDRIYCGHGNYRENCQARWIMTSKNKAGEKSNKIQIYWNHATLLTHIFIPQKVFQCFKTFILSWKMYGVWLYKTTSECFKEKFLSYMDIPCWFSSKTVITKLSSFSHRKVVKTFFLWG